MSDEPETPESEFVRKWKHDGNATMIQAVQIIATLTAERDALRTALEKALNWMESTNDYESLSPAGHAILRDEMKAAREALGGKS